MKHRILVLGSGHIAARVAASLAATDWAEPILFTGSPGMLTVDTLSGIHAVFNGTTGRPAVIHATARALYGVLHAAHTEMRVVHLSSMTVYGSFTGVADESAPIRADIGGYGESQIEAESLARAYPRCVVLRPGCEYGPGCREWSLRIARLLAAHRLGDLGAAGDGVCNLLYVDDLVTAVERALRTSGINGICLNLAMPGAPTWNEYFIRFAKVLGAVPVSRIAQRKLRFESRLLAPALKGLELVEQRITGRAAFVPPPITRSLLDLCRQDITLTGGRAERALDLEWTALHDGLERTAASLRARGAALN